MAKDVITRFKLETTQFDSKIKDAAKGLSEYTRTASNAGKEFQKFTKDNIDAARALGTMATSSMDAKGKVNELVGAFNDAAKAYNALTKEQQQSDFGKAMSQSLTQLQQRIRETKEELRNLSSGSGGGLFGGGKLDGMLQVFGGNLMTKGAGMLAGLANEVGDMIKQGTELAKQGEGIRIAFERLGRGDILQGLREATHGTVTDLELMKAAVKFNDFKLPVEELGTMLAFAQQKAKDTGQSVDYMVDSIVTGLGRKSLMILDNLGLSASEIKEKMAETGDMTKAVGAIIREQMAAAGDYVETAADRAQQANVSLQNKMEELGRKFGPLQEASNNFWTSMKIGILDVIGGPLANLLNKLTETGRMMNAYSQMGGNGKVGQMTANLAGARESNRQSIYQKQQQQFLNYINPREQQIKDIHAWQRGERGEALQGRINTITQKYGSLDATKIQAEVDAAKKMLADYKQAAKGILTPVKIDINTSQAEQNVESLKKKLADLQAQRKKAIAAGDTDLSKNLYKQINQTKADIRGLDPNALKTTGSVSKKLTDAEKAQQVVDNALLSYAQTIKEADLRMEAGLDTSLDHKKKELHAQEQLFTAYGRAIAIHEDPKFKEAYDKASKEYQHLAEEVKQQSDEQAKTKEVARQQAATQKKLTEAMDAAAKAVKENDLKSLYAANKKVEAVGGRAMDVPVTITYTNDNLQAFIDNLKEQINDSNVGADLYNKLTAQLADATALGNLISIAMKNGIDVAEFDPQELWKKLFGENPGDYIDDDVWKQIAEKISKQSRKKVKIDTKTGSATEKGDGEKNKSAVGVADQMVGGISRMTSSLEKLGIDIPIGFTEVLGGISSVIGVLQAIQIICEAINAMQEIGSFLGIFANGGIVPHAASGHYVGGGNYSGDTTPILANAGELILNKAEQGNLATQLEGTNIQNLRLEATVKGEDIRLSLNNNGRRRGRGEYVTTKFVRG